jgi:hypothetical protein
MEPLKGKAMPKTSDPFITVTEGPIKGVSGGGVTVIRKGSKYADQYAKSVRKAGEQYAQSDKPSKPEIRRKAAQAFGADIASGKAKVAAEMANRNYKKGGMVKK